MLRSSARRVNWRSKLGSSMGSGQLTRRGRIVRRFWGDFEKMKKLACAAVVALSAMVSQQGLASVTEDSFRLDTFKDLVALCGVAASDPNASAAIHMCHGYVTGLVHFHELMGRAPAGTGHWLAALDFYVSSPKEVVIIGSRSNPATGALLGAVNGGFHPNKVLVGADDAGDHGLPLLEARGMLDGQPTAYVCQNYACQLPVTTPEALAAQLEG